MRSTTTISVLAAVAVVLGTTVSGCASGRDDSAETGSGAATSETSAAPATDDRDVDDYLLANGVTQTVVKAGEPGVPNVELPMPDGWEPVTDAAAVPPDAYGAIFLSAGEGTPNPPAILVRMVRLDGGTFDAAKILELSPNAVRALPAWTGPEIGTPGEVGGFRSSEIAGRADIDGVPNFVSRETIVIPGPEHTYLLLLDAQGPLDQQQAIIAATKIIDERTIITP
ncbi:LpqN/LpqT family lipoprotein [Mycobacterium sp. ITM-2016-00317]|uniref:LpqN/LpqT family lipoprotein n=1 Tax=Mycobacterium sp. ITM-2016-00317 TaxID=2099694 RepID=UPI00287F6B5F|nr:LpqN/LpqT family lipoprotein [Mycobacterium sp. ITM-2016-00317]WNG88727.1 LpqN/LpqT family lipoprotein [Mycobacterium sp. ITM-2016-00317]